jgi:antimicrobial peptide system SdpB family protein
VLARLGARARAWAAAHDPHTNVYGLARTLVALGTLGTLLFSAPDSLFRPAVGVAQVPNCPGLARAGMFCVAGAPHLEMARWLAVAALALVASGWRPRLTSLLHWYVTFSFFSSAVMVDGGDQVCAILSLLLVPVALTDRRRWHWHAPLAAPAGAAGRLPNREAAMRLVALSCLAVVRLQVAGIYFQAAVSKMKVTEWRDGTAVYYWFTDPWFGLAEPVRHWALPLLANGLVVAAFTWGAMILEIFLFAGLLAERRYRRALLPLGISFHAGIALVHGLLSFALGMWAGLLLFLHPVDEELAGLRTRGARLLAALRPRPRLAAVPSPVPMPAAAVARAVASTAARETVAR